MIDRLLSIATVAAVSVPVAVEIVFFSAVVTMVLMGFGVFSIPY